MSVLTGLTSAPAPRYQMEVDRIKEAVRQRNLARRGHAPQIGQSIASQCSAAHVSFSLFPHHFLLRKFLVEHRHLVTKVNTLKKKVWSKSSFILNCSVNIAINWVSYQQH